LLLRYLKSYIYNSVAELRYIKDVLGLADKIKNLSKIYTYARNFLYLGRGYNYPTALEGALKLKEKGYIPTTKDGWKIKSGTVSIKADRYYVSVLVEIPDAKIADNSNDGMGIDLGLKDLAIVSNGKIYKNINKSARVKKLEKKLRREQRCLSRKYENLKKGESTQKNIQKQKLKVQKLHHRIDNIRTDYINKTIAEIVKTKPSYITIEDLNVSGMIRTDIYQKPLHHKSSMNLEPSLKRSVMKMVLN
jgi:putative transposase